MLTLKQADAIASHTLEEGDGRKLKPLCVIVLDAGGHLLALKRDERASINRPQIALGKASACIGLGVGGRTLAAMADARPVFTTSLSTALPNGCVPVQGGVLIKSPDGNVIGAVGVTGDLSENDEACALAGIEAVGLTGDPGT